MSCRNALSRWSGRGPGSPPGKRSMAVIPTGNWHSKQAGCYLREPCLHHTGEAVKGRMGANGNPAGEGLQPYHMTQSRHAMNSRAKGNATCVSLSPKRPSHIPNISSSYTPLPAIWQRQAGCLPWGGKSKSQCDLHKREWLKWHWGSSKSISLALCL